MTLYNHSADHSVTTRATVGRTYAKESLVKGDWSPVKGDWSLVKAD